MPSVDTVATEPGARATSTRPWLTVLIPTYNRATFLPLSLGRLLGLVANDAGIQVVVSDNHSLDGTSEILRQFGAVHPRLETVSPPHHLPSAEENIAFALAFCNGEHAWIIGDDDYITDDAFTIIRRVLSEKDFDFFLFNTRMFYAPELIAPPMIPMMGVRMECPIAEILARVGMTTIGASVSCVVLRVAGFRRSLPAMLAISPYYAHVAAYLDAFRDGVCGFGDQPIVHVREAVTAPVSFGEVMALTDVRCAGPWGFGIAAHIARLVETGAVQDDFLSTVVELGHENRYGLEEYILIHCLKQIRAWSTVGDPAEAVLAEDLDALRLATRGSGPGTRETVSQIGNLCQTLSSIYREGRADDFSDPLGPPLGRLLQIVRGETDDLIDVFRRWVDRETAQIEARLQSALMLRHTSRIVDEVGDYVVIRRGIDLIAIRRDVLGDVRSFCDLDSVNPLANPPLVLIARTGAAIRAAVQDTATPSETFGSYTLFAAPGVAVASRDEEASTSNTFVAKSAHELRMMLARGDAAPARPGTDSPERLDSLMSENADLFDPDWYADRYGLSFGGHGPSFRQEAFSHFLERGLQSGFSPSVWFDEDWYCTTWFGGRDQVRGAGFAGGIDHFLREGSAKPLSTTPLVDLPWYVATYRDVRDRLTSGFTRNPLQDYFLFGAQAGHSLSPIFDELWYRRTYPDIRARVLAGEFVSGLHHFLMRGRFEGFELGSSFSEAAYLAANPDVAQAVAAKDCASGLEHWLRFGRGEGRRLAPPGYPRRPRSVHFDA